VTDDRDGHLKIAMGSVYDPPDEPYRRLLIMRRWPRGVPRDAVDDWERQLGPSDELLDAYNDGAIDWDGFASRYRAEMAERSELVEWVARQASRAGVTLLCGSHPEELCHRSLLAELMRERAAAGLE
jgi:uncharacterized protein YeaO (DUF488 family)